MSLYGALFSGVSGLVAQSSAMGAISDNITNVSTIGYKNTSVSFQTLVTKQTSSTFYSAGGVQSKPLQATDVQGLLQASTSQTDVSISGNGFFVVNEASTPTNADSFLYTRAGSFTMDNDGFLKNTAGFYLQGWPVTAAGVVKPANSALTIANQNIISTDYLATVNMNRVGGTATPTSTIGIGANLPANAGSFNGTLSDITQQDAYQKTDVQFFDSLGNANTMSYEYIRTASPNQWDVRVEPPSGAAVVTLYDQLNGTNTADVYNSTGHLEFTGTRPPDGSYVSINGNTYEFDTNATVTPAPVAQVDTLTPGADGVTDVGDVFWVTIGSTSVSYTSTGGTLADVTAGLTAAINGNANLAAAVTAVDTASTTVVITSDHAGATFTTGVSTVNVAGGAATQTLALANTTIASGRISVDKSATTTLSADLDALITKVRNADADFSVTAADHAFGTTSDSTHKISKKRGNDNAIVMSGGANHLGDINVDITGLISGTTPLTNQGGSATKTFTVQATNTFGKTAQIDTVTPATVQVGDIFATSLHGISVSFTATAATVANVTAGLTAAINNNAALAKLVTAVDATTGVTITSDYAGLGFTTTTTTTDGGGTGTQTLTAVTTTQSSTGAIAFNADGLPKSFSFAEMGIKNFANGAADQDNTDLDGDGTADIKRVTMDFGTVAEANGMTQFGASFTPVFITQNGSRFGTFAGVTISTDGLVTALFDNGEIRHVYKLPLATFVNPNQLGSRSGNVWNATQASGDYTLREADNGPAGQVTQSALEASTVDIGSEFTNMIVVQRAYSASTKIISTADEMLEELMRTKR
jgi:flagellar hook protein FlgE